VFYNRGVALRQLGRLEEALADYDRAILIKPDLADAHFNRGNICGELRRFETALASYQRAIASKPDHAAAYLNLGNVQRELGQFAAALSSFDHALTLRPNFAEGHANKGHVLWDLKEYEAAIASYGLALGLEPRMKLLLGQRLWTKMQICDWRDFAADVAALELAIERSEVVCNPFFLLALSGSAALQKKAAEIWAREHHPPEPALPAISKRAKREKIRLGYFSADYLNHPVSMLTAGLIENHDRSKFEVVAISLGPDTNDEMRVRMQRAFDRFIDVRAKSDREIALLARELGLDIAMNLGGYTVGSRPKIFAMRTAPVQVGYLGYLGTMGAAHMDYLIADYITVPSTHRVHYTEKLVYLPSYQVNDSKRYIPDKRFARSELGLPPSGFVFCCFNYNYKFSPSTFEGWMRILRQVPGSVLFLYASNAVAKLNLRKEARRLGIASERILFGEKLSYPEYLARFSAADLFLDTLPYNAGTTASDALWAGLPVVTCLGEAFASRVAASLLHAVGLPELVATSQAEYEKLAIALATEPQRLAEIRDRLANNRLSSTLFNTQSFTDGLESALIKMHERSRAGLPPDSLQF
jgi:predicted O-linked N-acetylglucosamine transferase (SPINDLY family)